jgi:hypothetical protein
MKRFGYVDMIVWNERTGNIVGGHQRYSLLFEGGVEEADMMVVDLSPEDEIAANLTLNNPEIEGEWDDPAADLLERIEAVDPEFFTEGGLDDLRKELSKVSESNEKDDADTECPCCGHRWKISDTDVVVLTKEEQEKAGETGRVDFGVSEVGDSGDDCPAD